jgi:5'(3')-deoxyribonucleotidase
MGVTDLMKLYVDLDGVLTDFNKKLSEVMGKPFKNEFSNDPSIWKAITKAGAEFWSTMEWLPGGRDLWEELKKYDPTILSAPSNHPSSVEGKKEWLKDNIPGVPFILEQKKEKYANEDSILIDDREKNIKRWEAAGGIGILHKNPEKTLEGLKKVLKPEDKNFEREVKASFEVSRKLRNISNILDNM